MRYTLKTIVSLIFITIVICFVYIMIHIENGSFSKKTETVEKTTISTEKYPQIKDSVSLLIPTIIIQSKTEKHAFTSYLTNIQNEFRLIHLYKVKCMTAIT